MQPVSLKSVLKRTLKKLDLYDIYRRQRALLMWERVCGKDVAKISRAIRLRGSVLMIGVVDHIWATELSNFSYEYIRKYNRLVGPGVVAEIRFKPDARLFSTKKQTHAEFNLQEVDLPKKDVAKIEEMTSELTNDTVRDLMQKFLANKFKHDRWLKKRGGEQCYHCGVLLPKGECYCPHCVRELEVKNAAKLRELLENEPWTTFADAQRVVIPITLELYDHTKEVMMRKLYRNIIDGMEKTRKLVEDRESTVAEIKGWIITYAMLLTCNRPVQLKDSVLQSTLPGVMYNFYRTGKVS